MSERQRLPRYIVVLNIIMVIIILAICGLAFALTWTSKDIGWTVPSTPGNSVSAAQTGETSDIAEGTAVVSAEQ